MSQNESKSVKEAKGLAVGAQVANFSATNQKGETFILSEALQKGPVVVIFYRGQWCPVCNKHLGQVQDSLQQIYNHGATVVAISPEKTEYLAKTAEKTHASFTLLYDEGYAIANQFDVTFDPDSATKVVYNVVLGANLKNAHSDDSQRLPIPATFIIGQDHKIVWRQFDPDYKKRSTVSEILKNIP
ncbi:MAG: alkyl hydroperoxide reductase [Bacteroidetes bacterium HGW-Bacteroidetes-9]|nr:MAG: alkyl hydroperoxide reductase [Bacteroidetes bacterium HGW-Bacteroidetes-9]